MKYMNFKEFYDRLCEYCDQMQLGIRNTDLHRFAYINLIPFVNDCTPFHEFITLRFTQMNYHEIGYIDEFMEWHYHEFHDDVIPEWILDRIKDNYPKAAKTIKFDKIKIKYEKLQEDFK